jgi:hypothetical protein
MWFLLEGEQLDLLADPKRGSGRWVSGSPCERRFCGAAENLATYAHREPTVRRVENLGGMIVPSSSTRLSLFGVYQTLNEFGGQEQPCVVPGTLANASHY